MIFVGGVNKGANIFYGGGGGQWPPTLLLALYIVKYIMQICKHINYEGKIKITDTSDIGQQNNIKRMIKISLTWHIKQTSQSIFSTIYLETGI